MLVFALLLLFSPHNLSVSASPLRSPAKRGSSPSNGSLPWYSLSLIFGAIGIFLFTSYVLYYKIKAARSPPPPYVRRPERRVTQEGPPLPVYMETPDSTDIVLQRGPRENEEDEVSPEVVVEPQSTPEDTKKVWEGIVPKRPTPAVTRTTLEMTHTSTLATSSASPRQVPPTPGTVLS